MKVLRFFLILILGMVLGVVLVFGGVALYVYNTASQPGAMEKVDEYVSPIIPVEWDDEIKEMSVLDYFQLATNVFLNLSDTEISEVEKVLGLELISKNVEDSVGISQDKVKASTLSGLGATISENLTFQIAKDKMNLELNESMKLFKNEEFMNTPLQSVLSNITKYPLDQFVVVVYDEDATEETPASKPIIQKLGKTPVEELSTNVDEVVQDSTIGELVKINEESAKILQYLQDTKIKDLSDAINTMKLKDMIVIDESSHNILKKLQDLTVEQLSDSSVTTPIIESMKISELIEVDDDSPKLMHSIKDTELKDLGDKMDSLTLSEVYENPEQGPLSIIDPDTRLEDIPAVIGKDIPNASLYALNKAGIFELNEPSTLSGKVIVYNTTMQKALQVYADAVDGGGSIASKRYFVYLYDNASLFANEQNSDAPYASNADVKNIVRHYNQDPLFQAHAELKAVDISTKLTKDADGYYQITDDFLSTLWDDERIHNGTEIILQQDVNVELIGDPESEENTYNSVFSVSGIYEHKAYTAIFDPLTDLCAEAKHASIRVGQNIKIKNRVGGYAYFRNLASKIETQDVDGVYSPYDGIYEPEILRKMVGPSATETDPNPVLVPNIRIDYIILP